MSHDVRIEMKTPQNMSEFEMEIFSNWLRTVYDESMSIGFEMRVFIDGQEFSFGDTINADNPA